MTADPADLADVVARFGAALRAAGVPVGPDRCERFARAIVAIKPATTRALYHCGLVTLVADPAHIELYDAVFAAVFGGLDDQAQWRGQQRPSFADSVDTSARQAKVRVLAAAAERLSTRDFGELTAAELAELAGAMRRLTLATPVRRSRRYQPAARGHRVDLRSMLRQARRSGGFPVRVARRTTRLRRRRLVVLCDISGSMEPYARAMLQLLYCAAGGASAEVFTFATRLTRLTRALRRVSPHVALERAGQLAPDWSSGTRIGAAVKEFNERHGLRGMARGAVLLVISDGWDTGDPALLGRELARLSRVAYRVVWANPRTASPRFRPMVGGMAAAWQYCDAVVSAHRLSALDDLLAALAASRRG
ncbi:MAG TPA: VWA domain-containing protein [Micromonosporaceae bacterium]|nr:VWA domain-containing protein [Micromonosporaceae bacterium]